MRALLSKCACCFAWTIVLTVAMGPFEKAAAEPDVQALSALVIKNSLDPSPSTPISPPPLEPINSSSVDTLVPKFECISGGFKCELQMPVDGTIVRMTGKLTKTGKFIVNAIDPALLTEKTLESIQKTYNSIPQWTRKGNLRFQVVRIHENARSLIHDAETMLVAGAVGGAILKADVTQPVLEQLRTYLRNASVPIEVSDTNSSQLSSASSSYKVHATAIKDTADGARVGLVPDFVVASLNHLVSQYGETTWQKNLDERNNFISPFTPEEIQTTFGVTPEASRGWGKIQRNTQDWENMRAQMIQEEHLTPQVVKRGDVFRWMVGKAAGKTILPAEFGQVLELLYWMAQGQNSTRTFIVSPEIEQGLIGSEFMIRPRR